MAKDIPVLLFNISKIIQTLNYYFFVVKFEKKFIFDI